MQLKIVILLIREYQILLVNIVKTDMDFTLESAWLIKLLYLSQILTIKTARKWIILLQTKKDV
jgi:hypothetical protein